MPKHQRESLIFQAFLSFRPSSTVAYARCMNPPSRAHVAHNLNNTLKRSETSIQTRRKMRTIIDWMMILCPVQYVYSKELNKTFRFRLGFITLTLPSVQTHKDSYLNTHLLQPFLRTIKAKYKVNHYVWKAETQGNGNIHYHVIVNKFIHYKLIRHHWNILLNKLGYFDQTKFKESIFEANTTDVHSVYKVKNLAAYLSKYLSKTKSLSNSVRLTNDRLNKPIVQDDSDYLIDSKGLVWQFRRPVKCKSFGVSESIRTNGISFEQGTHQYNFLTEWLKTNTEKELQPNDYIKIYVHKQTSIDFNKQFLIDTFGQ